MILFPWRMSENLKPENQRSKSQAKTAWVLTVFFFFNLQGKSQFYIEDGWGVLHKILLRFQDIDEIWTSHSPLFFWECSEEHSASE